jgi:hypothetical protein
MGKWEALVSSRYLPNDMKHCVTQEKILILIARCQQAKAATSNKTVPANCATRFFYKSLHKTKLAPLVLASLSGNPLKANMPPSVVCTDTTYNPWMFNW